MRPSSRVFGAQVWAVVFGSAMALAASVAFVTPASADGAPACGDKKNPCPMQKWMQDNIGAQMADGNLAGVATGLDKAATMSPDPSWTEWAKMSKDGADAARKGDKAGAKASCKSCHDKYKQAYKDKYRTRPVP
jgi:hypothetical protein